MYFTTCGWLTVVGKGNWPVKLFQQSPDFLTKDYLGCQSTRQRCKWSFNDCSNGDHLRGNVGITKWFVKSRGNHDQLLHAHEGKHIE